MKLKKEQVNALCKLVILSEEMQGLIDSLQYSDFHNTALQKKLRQVNEMIEPILNTFHIDLYKAHPDKVASEQAYSEFVLIQKDFNECLQSVASIHPDKVRYLKIVLSMFSKLPEPLLGYLPALIEALANGEIKIENEVGELKDIA